MKPTKTKAKLGLIKAIFLSFFLILSFIQSAIADVIDPSVIRRLYADLATVSKPTGPVDRDLILYLVNFEYREVIEQVLMRLQYEVENTENLSPELALEKAKVISATFYVAGQISTSEQLETIRKITYAVHAKYLPLMESILSPEIFYEHSEQIDVILDYMMATAAKRTKKLPSLQAISESVVGLETTKSMDAKLARNISDIKPMVIKAESTAVAIVAQHTDTSMSPVDSLKDLDRIIEYLHKRVIDQEEAIERIKSIELTERLYKGTSTKPSVVMLMGSPGTGKDTIVENWVDAVYNKENAYHDHLFRLPVMKTEADRWGVLGSTTGHIGSEQLAPFIKWLVRHSGGRYMLKTTDRGGQYITEDPLWKPGMVLEGYSSPDKAFVFANEFHNWSKDIKDSFIKQVMEKGFVQINNPGSGVDKLYVPFRMIIASNDGIGLVTSREANGQRFGKPLSYEEQLQRWQNVYRDHARLKEELLKLNGSVNGRGGGTNYPVGYSEEFINRIPSANMILMKPLSPEGIKKIATIELERFKTKLAASTVKVELAWDQSVLDFVQSFDYLPEENARPVEYKVSSLIIDTFHSAVSDQTIKSSDKSQKISLSVIQNTDQTYSLRLSGKINKVIPIKGTSHLKDAQPMTDEELKKWFDLEERLNKKVVGAEFVTKQLAREILLNQEGRNKNISEANAKESARVFMFLGPSSVGKTEMAKALATEVYGDVSVMKTFDAGRVTSKAHLEEMFLGMHDGAGNPIPSRFMKEFDRNNGRLIVNLDEIANAPREVLKALYDVFREPVVRTFSDGKARVMTNVIFILTGNVGEEWYSQIPRNIPVEEQKAAMQEIYKEAMKSPGYRRMYLEHYFSEALLARIGEDRIFFFSPLSEKSIRELSMMKLNQAIESLKPTVDSRGWEVLFVNKAEYEKFLNVVEEEGFVLREQGASIDRAFKETVFKALKETLIRGLAGNGKKVALFVKGVTEKDKRTGDPGDVIFGAYVEGQKDPLTFSMKRRAKEVTPQFTAETQITTAFHETGHELVRYALFHDVYETEKLTIIPGVTEISGNWIRYLGLVRYDESKYVEYSRKAVVRMMAISAGGYVAQQLVTRGAVDDAGKLNDMEHATWLARMAVMKWGLSKKWGTRSVPADVALQDYYASLPDSEKSVVESEVSILVKEAEELARSVLLANYEKGFIPLAMMLAEKGTIYGDEMAKFYKDNKIALYRESDGTFMQKARSISLKSLAAKFSNLFPASQKRDAELLPTLPRPKKIATMADVVKAHKEEQSKIVPDESKLPILKNTKGFEAALAAHGDNTKKCVGALLSVLKK